MGERRVLIPVMPDVHVPRDGDEEVRIAQVSRRDPEPGVADQLTEQQDAVRLLNLLAERLRRHHA